jgi:hypothetical protein
LVIGDLQSSEKIVAVARARVAEGAASSVRPHPLLCQKYANRVSRRFWLAIFLDPASAQGAK